jgi:hypothetical protein
MDNISARMVYENAREAVRAAFKNVPNILQIAKLTQGSLRVSQAMVVGQTLYQFPILVNETQLGIFNTEQRLNLQDSFVVSQMGIFVSNPASSLDAAYRLMSYPNPVAFGAGPAAALQALYNGTIKLTVDNNVLIPIWDVDRHLYQPETQQTAALGAGSPNDEISGQHSSFYPVEPNVVFIGSKNNVLQLQLPVGLTSILANSRIEILFRGVLAQNTTSVN